MDTVISAVVPGAKLNNLAVDLSKITVGFEFEFISPISHQSFADVMRDTDLDYKIGAVTKEYAGHKTKYPGKNLYSFWHITGDDSIDTAAVSDDTKSLYGIEVISPVLPLAKAKKALLDIVAIIKRAGGTTNESCGLHITFGHPLLTTDLINFDPLKFAVFMQEDKVLERFDRERNEYAQNFSSRILKAMYEEMHELKNRVFQREQPNFEETDEANYPENYYTILPNEVTGPALTEENLQEFLTSLRVRQRFALYSHYLSINLIKLRNHCVEVRSPGGDYLSQDAQGLAQMVLHMARCLAVALDPTLLETQYVLAVRRMLKQYNAPKQATDAKRAQQELNVNEVSKASGQTSISGKVKIAGQSVLVTITHGAPDNPRADASVAWAVMVEEKHRIALRLYVDNFGITEVVLPSKYTLQTYPVVADVAQEVSNQIIRAASKMGPVPGLVKISPSISAYKKLLARFPKLAAIKMNVSTFQSRMRESGLTPVDA